MEKEKLNIWNKLERVLSNPIRHCKICFEKIDDYSFFALTNRSVMCERCFAKFTPKFIHFRVDGFSALALYEYDSTIRDLIFKFKGCYDIELKDVFMDRYINYLKIRYYGYHIVPLPSYIEDDERRGFNHVEQIYNRLNLPILKVLKKINNEKQAKKRKKERLMIQKNFKNINPKLVNGKKILIVDDVFTTGSSMRAAINLVRLGNPKKISVLVIAKNIERHSK